MAYDKESTKQALLQVRKMLRMAVLSLETLDSCVEANHVEFLERELDHFIESLKETKEDAVKLKPFIK